MSSVKFPFTIERPSQNTPATKVADIDDANGVNLETRLQNIENNMGGDTTQIEADILELQNATFPLTVGYVNKDNTNRNDGSYEYGASVTPKTKWTIKRKGANVTDATVTPTSTIQGGALAQDGLSYAGSAVRLTSEVSFSAVVSKGSQTASLGALKWTPKYYRYKMEIALNSSDPNEAAVVAAFNGSDNSALATAIETLINARNLASSKKEFEPTDNPQKLGTTSVASFKLYLFAVKGTFSINPYTASPKGPITGFKTGTCSLKLQNDYTDGNNQEPTFTYTYVVVPASDSGANWDMIIE